MTHLVFFAVPPEWVAAGVVLLAGVVFAAAPSAGGVPAAPSGADGAPTPPGRGPDWKTAVRVLSALTAAGVSMLLLYCVVSRGGGDPDGNGGWAGSVATNIAAAQAVGNLSHAAVTVAGALNETVVALLPEGRHFPTAAEMLARGDPTAVAARALGPWLPGGGYAALELVPQLFLPDGVQPGDLVGTAWLEHYRADRAGPLRAAAHALARGVPPEGLVSHLVFDYYGPQYDRFERYLSAASEHLRDGRSSRR